MLDVHLSDLKRDPLGEVRRLYRELGIELTAEAEQSMRSWLDKKRVRHGGHNFSLRQFNLSEAQVMANPVFKRYCREYHIEGCVEAA